MIDRAALIRGYSDVFSNGSATTFVRAPGRVNLIGEHTDYNDGFVLPIALEQAMHVAAARGSHALIRVRSGEMAETIEFDPRHPPTVRKGEWASYVVGVIALLREAGVALPGANLYLASTVPLGGGLSSSASLEVGVALALLALADVRWEKMRVADLCRAAEHRYAGTPCGIMDQLASLLSREGHALLLDCRTRQYEHVPIPVDDLAVLVIDTQVRHDLSAGEYALRVEACRAGVAHFARLRPGIRALRDVTPEDLRIGATGLDPVVAKRCRHVIEENARVHEFVAALRARDFARLGRAMYASHISLRNLYEVSCEELDSIVETLQRVPGVVGARMTGGGFGGSAVALVRHDAVEAARQALAREYDSKHAKPALPHLTRPSAGAEVANG